MPKIIAILLVAIVVGSEHVHKPDWDKELFERINKYRKEKGLSEFIWDSEVHDMANHHSIYQGLLGNDDCTHDELIKVEGLKRLKEPEDRFAKYHKGDFKWVSENVGYIKESENVVEDFFIGWLNSPPHNRNILSKGKKLFAAVCVTYIEGTGYYATLNIYQP